MRTPQHPDTRQCLRAMLISALVATSTNAIAIDKPVDGADAPAPNAHATMGQGKIVIERVHSPIDSTHVASWQGRCEEDQGKDGCKTIVKRFESRPLLGVLFAPDPQGGVRIAGVTPDGAASGAGIRTGDRLLRINGKKIAGDTPAARVDAARELLQASDGKTPIKLLYARGDIETEVGVTPKRDQRVMVFTGDGSMMNPGGSLVIHRVRRDGTETETDAAGFDMLDGALTHDVTGNAPTAFVFSTDSAQDGEGGHPRIERHILRLDCKQGEPCAGQQRLAEAFRWNGLNLASVDKQLGRYFGTESGVLVLSTGPALGQLQAGDVIQRVDGKPVQTPRAVMDALRDKPEGSNVGVSYLRDRKSGTAQIKVPKTTPFPPMPPIPPAPPIAPMPPAPPRPPKASAAPHALMPGMAKTQRHIVVVDKNGQVQTWDDNGNGSAVMPPAPPMPPPPPPRPRVD
jgi:membrane-associated protease RseP (regulator of RpoE activity)